MSRVIWSVIAELALAGWVTGTLALIFTSFYGRRFDSLRGAKFFLPIILMYLLWIAGMLNA